jgi:hypothetical protein
MDSRELEEWRVYINFEWWKKKLDAKKALGSQQTAIALKGMIKNAAGK